MAGAVMLAVYENVGHGVKLYSFGPVKNVPEDIEVADAETIYSPSVLGFDLHKYPAQFRDVWRLHMMVKTGGLWCDRDTLAIKAIVPSEEGFVLSTHAPGLINNAVLKIPRHHRLLRRLCNEFANRNAFGPWVAPRFRQGILERKAAGEDIPFWCLPYGSTGPKILHFFCKRLVVAHIAEPPEVYSPITAKNRGQSLRAGLKDEHFVTPNTKAVHLWGGALKIRMKDNGIDRPHPTSFLGRACEKYTIDFSSAPLL